MPTNVCWNVDFRWVNPSGLVCHAGLEGDLEATHVTDAIERAAIRLGVDVALCFEVHARRYGTVDAGDLPDEEIA